MIKPVRFQVKRNTQDVRGRYRIQRTLDAYHHHARSMLARYQLTSVAAKLHHQRSIRYYETSQRVTYACGSYTYQEWQCHQQRN